jgi:hypothetical protein
MIVCKNCGERHHEGLYYYLENGKVIDIRNNAFDVKKYINSEEKIMCPACDSDKVEETDY